MAKTAKKENVRVEVTQQNPRQMMILPKQPQKQQQVEEEQIRNCQELVSQIKRHVDGIGYCDVVYDVNYYCEFCGMEWAVNTDYNDPDSAVGEPLCCHKASEEWKAKESGEGKCS
jgi:hypothetical protein